MKTVQKIKTTQRRAVLAHRIIQRMSMKVAGKAAFTLFRLKKQLKEIVEFQGEEQEKLVAKYGGKIAENGMILIADKGKRTEFDREDKELGAMECEIQPVDIRAADIPDITLEEIEILDGFVNFTEEE